MSDEVKAKNLSNSAFLDLAYASLFNRSADTAGKNGWLSSLSSGMSREFVISGFTSSTEFSNLCKKYSIKQGATGSTQNRDINPKLTAYVNRMYTKVLGRTGDESGLNYWCGEVLSKRLTPKQVADNFIFSKEFMDKKYGNVKFIEILYRTFLGREADDSGKQYWISRMNNGATREQLANEFANSPEFAEIIKGFGL